MPDSHDHAQRLLAQLRFPSGDEPQAGTIKNVAPQVYWLRMPLPFQLNHINLWLVEDNDGWSIVDTGINMPETQQHWEVIFANALNGKPVKRVVVTHMHPDHVGLAGWLCERWNAPMHMTLGDYMSSQAIRNGIVDGAETRGTHLLANGVPADQVEIFARHRGGYSKGVGPLPPSFERLIHGHPLMMGGRRWQVIVGRGHAPEHASLWCPDLNVLISGDQVLPKISTNVGVWPNEPRADALSWFLDSFARFRALPSDALVLPSHGFPFVGLHTRLDQLIAHHDARLGEIAAAVAQRGEAGATAWDMVPTLFPRHLDNNQVVFAFAETLAHMHCLETRGHVTRRTGHDGVHRFVFAKPVPPPTQRDDDSEVFDVV
ncbi:MBL fold metallo-hydrolase [Vineibacter terrae]|uniref:MBL fold metallo-hydrolase n=1 Tax=Vineibacter terrae TaxID=2586908 RepID=UPI002E326E0B|nr:MBL fold metallo-hydrolase [Vineibacter terrae]HEX2886160.1 MBL fold metallo-hydrolase [Vineibacter terrae]